MDSLLHAALDERILRACDRAKRSRGEITLVAVTKTHTVETCLKAYALGLRDFGENRAQELLQKQPHLPKDIRWHFIGHLQSNKVNQVAPIATLIHSVDALSTAIALSKRAEVLDRKIEALIEINISGESQKHGIPQEQASAFVGSIIAEAKNIELRGLMGVASNETDIERTRPQFAALRALRSIIALEHQDLRRFDQLSMGMSHDFEVAIEEGATIIRIGSALFGARPA